MKNKPERKKPIRKKERRSLRVYVLTKLFIESAVRNGVSFHMINESQVMIKFPSPKPIDKEIQKSENPLDENVPIKKSGFKEKVDKISEKITSEIKNFFIFGSKNTKEDQSSRTEVSPDCQKSEGYCPTTIKESKRHRKVEKIKPFNCTPPQVEEVNPKPITDAPRNVFPNTSQKEFQKSQNPSNGNEQVKTARFKENAKRIGGKILNFFTLSPPSSPFNH